MHFQDRKKQLIFYGATIVIVIVGLSLLIVGVVRQQKKSACVKEQKTEDSKKFVIFIRKVQRAYYTSNPNKYIFMPDAKTIKIKEQFRPYDSTPMAIKKQTDISLALLEEMNDINLNQSNLKLRERKAFAQIKHYLQSVFGQPYDADYYAGDWLLGPNYFCRQPICYMGYDFRSHLNPNVFKPKTKADFDFIINTLIRYEQSINQYVKNLQYGVRSGMVASAEACQAGINSIVTRYGKVSRKNETGILEERFIITSVKRRGYFDDLEKKVVESLQKESNMTLNVYIDRMLVLYLGKPLANFINYLRNNHLSHCPSSHNSSGLATLPLDYIWTDQKPNNSQPTTKKLPFGEPLNGKKAYEKILSYFTTNNMTPDQIYNLGRIQLDKLYPQALKIAKKVTNETDDKKAAIMFKTKWLDNTEMFFNSTPIPANESNKNAFEKCQNMKMARMYCPIRFKAMIDWFEYVQNILAMLEPKTRSMFYFTGPKATTPNCPVKIVAKFNPSSGSQSYSRSGKSCKRPSYYYLPFFLTPPGPKFNAISVAGHEGRPGHHTQVQGFQEHFLSSSSASDEIDWLNKITRYTAFSEGWGLYAENPLLAQGTDIYNNNLLQKYGMLRAQIWRALRLMIDPGLHYKGMKREDARKLFEDYAWDTTEKATKELTRYQSGPGQATAYMVGQLAIWRMRNYTEEKLKKAGMVFNEPEFHYHILSQGSSPLHYLDSYIKEFVDCKINHSKSECDAIVNPLSQITTPSDSKDVNDPNDDKVEMEDEDRYSEHSPSYMEYYE